MRDGHIVTLADPDALARHAASWLAGLASASAGRFAIALSGGSTPQRLYEILAGPPYRDTFPWAQTHIFFGDERMVPPDDALSNLRMAREALLDHVPVPPAQIYAMPTQCEPHEAARRYQETLQTYYGAETLDPAWPLFDVMLLGLGEDGHTASLFPGTSALEEAHAWVVPVQEHVPQPRLTLTYPVLASSAQAAFLVAGASKADALARVLSGDRACPAARITSIGTLTWFTDAAASPGAGR